MTARIFVIYLLKIFLFIFVLIKANFLTNYNIATLAKALRIVGGHSTTIVEHPYMVSIRHGQHFICGGTIISQNCMLTAAHCSILESPGSWEIHAGTSYIKSKGVMRKVRKWIVPAEFNFSTIDMDVAIVVLDKPFNVGNIRSIEIDYGPLREEEKVLVAGWGLKEEYALAKLSNELQAVNVSLTSIAECTKAYQPENNITRNMFCAIGSSGSDACQGDSGGPAIRRGKQVGIVSWGYRCGLPEYPGVYTRLSSAGVKQFLHFTISNYC